MPIAPDAAAVGRPMMQETEHLKLTSGERAADLDAVLVREPLRFLDLRLLCNGCAHFFLTPSFIIRLASANDGHLMRAFFRPLREAHMAYSECCLEVHGINYGRAAGWLVLAPLK